MSVYVCIFLFRGYMITTERSRTPSEFIYHQKMFVLISLAQPHMDLRLIH